MNKNKIRQRVASLFLSKVMADRDKDVKKATAWILRQMTYRNPEEAAEFLTTWAEANPNKDTRWIIKNSIEKLPRRDQDIILKRLTSD